MDIHVDICGFLEIHAWICCGFSDQGKNTQCAKEIRELLNHKPRLFS